MTVLETAVVLLGKNSSLGIGSRQKSLAREPWGLGQVGDIPPKDHAQKDLKYIFFSKLVFFLTVESLKKILLAEGFRLA